jgi:ribonuclease BN (tRNA processing enzyme)
LAAAGINLEDVRAVFLSHLHFDHTGGLAALLGLRYQTSVPGILTIYGPPGTKGLVHGLLESMHPAVEAGFGIPGAPKPSAEEGVRVIELFDGSKAQLPEIGVTAAENSHYSFAPGSVEAGRFKSLSYRFDLPERSIVYTGDTGPSTAVERLARSADLLVSEMIDLDATVQAVSTTRPNLPPAIVENLVRHLSTHHLLPAQVGELAARAGVKRVVVTHLVGVENESEARYVTAIHKHFSGPVVIAKDLDRF